MTDLQLARTEPPTPVPQRELYPLNEFCQKIGNASRASTYRWERQGKIKLVRIGGRTYGSAAEIARLARGDDPAKAA